MTTRGRKPKPTAMKELEGNPGKHPLNTSEPKPNKKAPACVRLLAESIAALPLHLYRVTDDNGNKEKARDHPLYKILYRHHQLMLTLRSILFAVREGVF